MTNNDVTCYYKKIINNKTYEQVKNQIILSMYTVNLILKLFT